MTIVKDKVLYSEQEFGSMDGCAPSEPTHFLEHYFKSIREKLADERDGERTAFLVNALIDMDLKSSAPLYGDVKLLLRDLEAKSRRAAAFLRSIGFAEGDTLHMAVSTVVEFYVPVMGALLNNGVASLGDPSMSAEHLCNQLKDTEAKVVICCQHNMDNVMQAVEEARLDHQVKIVVMRERGSSMDFRDEKQHRFNFEDMIDTEEPDVEVRPPDNLEAPALIYWSSGTTGLPKGIVHSWNHFWKVFESKISTTMDTNTIYVVTLCQFHLGGFLTPLVKVKKGRTINVIDADGLGDNTHALFEAINHYKPDTMLIGSHHCVRMAFFPISEMDRNWDFSSVVTVIPTGSTVPLETCENLRKKFTKMNRIANLYGSTELGTFVTFSFTQEMLGAVCNGASIRMEDVASGEVLGPNRVGEMLVKGSRTMLGYLKRPEENERVLLPDGFLRTGDLAYYDQKGNVYYKSRAKNVIKVMNHHIQPLEVERVLEEHPDVLEAGVFGIPDPFYQEAIAALVILRENSKISPEQLLRWANEKLEKYHKIRGGIRFVRDLPRGRTGKLLHRDLAKLWQKCEQ